MILIILFTGYYYEFIGEVGTEVISKKEAFINRYYKDMQVNHPRFAGGYFWWYGSHDMIPKTKPLWQFLQNAMDHSAIGIPAAPKNLMIHAKR